MASTYVCPHCHFENHVPLEGRSLAASTRCRRCLAAFALEDAERVAIAANDPNALAPARLFEEAEPESYRDRMPSKEQLAAPRVPSFDSSVAPIRRLGESFDGGPSLAPGASVFPRRGPRPQRTVPLLFAVSSSGLCLVIGALLGVIFGDLLLMPKEVLQMAPRTEATPGSAPFPVPTFDAPDESPAPVAPPQGVAPEKEPEGRAPQRPRSKAGPVAKAVAPEAVPESGGLPDKLGAAHIQRTVHKNQSGVRHGCWNRALAARAPTSPSSARVSVRITIAPSGQVTEATTAGEAPGYPGLAQCVAGKVRGWSFPKAAGSTRADLPFTFAAQ